MLTCLHKTLFPRIEVYSCSPMTLLANPNFFNSNKKRTFKGFFIIALFYLGWPKDWNVILMFQITRSSQRFPIFESSVFLNNV